MARLIFAIVTALLLGGCAGANFRTYNYSEDAPKSENFEVFLDGEPCYAYPAPGGDIANFDIAGEVEVRIRPLFKVESAVVRPLSAGVKPKIEDGEIVFSLSKPQLLCVEVNGDLERPLFVFANPPERDAPKKGDADVMFFESGKIHNIEQETFIPSSTTVYIEGGAIVYGTFLAGDNFRVSQSRDIRICGRGILSGEKIPWASRRQGKSSNLIQINTTENLRIEGITAVQSPNWTIPIFASNNIVIDGIKTVGKADWDDGIDIVSCRNVLVKNSFIYNRDDCIAIKAAVGYTARYFDHSKPNSVENVAVRDCVLWNGIYGNCLEIGFETRGDEIKNIVFENLDIIHTQDNPWYVSQLKRNPETLTGEMVFTIHNGDRAHVRDVLYKDIRVEDTGAGLIDFRIMFSRYSRDEKRGKISNIRMENISVTSPYNPPYSRIAGFDGDSNVSGITFKNFIVNGKKITSKKDLNLKEFKFAEGLEFQP